MRPCWGAPGRSTGANETMWGAMLRDALLYPTRRDISGTLCFLCLHSEPQQARKQHIPQAPRSPRTVFGRERIDTASNGMRKFCALRL